MERTLILVKPDAFARHLSGEIIARFERKGLRLVALKQMRMTRELAEKHYAEHKGKGFYDELVSFITSGPLVAMVLEGEQAVEAARQVIGATNPLQAATGSIRGDFAIEVGKNMVHGSDSPQSAAREVKLFFPALGGPGGRGPGRGGAARPAAKPAARPARKPGGKPAGT
jgi:nucleoside-diphosphate kinase